LTYCEFASTSPVHASYHAEEYGFYQENESVLFERLILEINQAGLSWETILKKREGFKEAYGAWSVDRVAEFKPSDIERLMADSGIIRNRLKIEAAIHNAQVIRDMRAMGGFNEWLRSLHPQLKADWVKSFKTKFRFTGGEIVGEFLMSLGYLPGAHDADCPIAEVARKSHPAWLFSR